MAGKSTTFSNQFLALILNGTAIPNIAINATSAPLTNLYIALHTADPGVAGTQATNEVTYTGYTRVPVARSTGGWTVSTNNGSPVANITWPNPTGAAGQTITFFSVGVASSGATAFLWSGAISPTQTIAVGIPPILTTASVIQET